MCSGAGVTGIKRRIIAACVAVVGSAVVLPVSAARAASFTVTTLADNDDGTCDVSHCSLREAINAANAAAGDDTITFGVNGTIALTANLPNITANGALTILGNGPNLTIIDGGGSFRSLSS